MVTLQRKIEILEDLTWRLKVIFERDDIVKTPAEATEQQYDAYFDLMVNLDNYVNETTEEDYENGDEFTVSLIDFIYPEADNLSTGKILLLDEGSLESVDGVWLGDMPLEVWKEDYDSEALDVCRYLLRKFQAMARGERAVE